jgi:1-phosphatidylinositol-3-phosphate 5-kinase
VVDEESNCTFEEALHRRRRRRKPSESWAYVTEQAAEQSASPKVLLDDNFIQLNCGRPFPLRKRAKEYLDKAVRNDSMFLSVINVVDYSILAGVDESSYTMRVGIIDYMRQYDIIKKMEHMGKSVGMLTGQGEPTIIEPAQYKKRLQLAMERYFMEVPDKWSEADRAAW